MTDMRATERLLEVIEEGLVTLRDRNDVDDLVEAITELRRRGDTLVRAADLRLALDNEKAMDAEWMGGPEFAAAIERLENAIKGGS